MDNKVGDSVPNQTTLVKLLKQLNDVITELRTFGITLSSEERKHLIRARKESAGVVQRMFELATKYNVTLPHVSLNGMQNDQHLVEAMRPFVHSFEEGYQLAIDTTAQAEHEAWQACLIYYGVLSSMASHLPELEHELAPIKQFMTTKPRKKEDNKPAKP